MLRINYAGKGSLDWSSQPPGRPYRGCGGDIPHSRIQLTKFAPVGKRKGRETEKGEEGSKRGKRKRGKESEKKGEKRREGKRKRRKNVI